MIMMTDVSFYVLQNAVVGEKERKTQKLDSQVTPSALPFLLLFFSIFICYGNGWKA